MRTAQAYIICVCFSNSSCTCGDRGREEHLINRNGIYPSGIGSDEQQ